MKVSLRKYVGAIAYPPGSIYCTTKEINPATIWGGTWEKLEGRFLFGSDDTHEVGTTGGEEEHALTESEMPRHRHAVHEYGNSGNVYSSSKSLNSSSSSSAPSYAVRLTKAGQGYTKAGENDLYRMMTLPVGNTNAHNNMPPYQVVHMWVRKTLRGGAN